MKYILTLTFIFSFFINLNSAGAQTCNGGTITAIRDTICQGTPGNLSLVGSSGSIQWQSATDSLPFTNLTGDSAVVLRTVPLVQSTWFRAVVTNGSNTCISDTLRLIVPPPLTSSFSTSDSGQVIIFTAQSVGAVVAYHWDFGDGQISSETNPTHYYGVPDTTFYACLTVYDGSNCSYTYCIYVTIGNGGGSHNPPAAPCSIYYILVPDSIPHIWDLYYNSLGSSPITYSWSWGDGGNSSVGDSGGHTYQGPGSYDICVTMRDDTGCVATYCDSSTYIFRKENDNDMIGVKSHYSPTLLNGIVSEPPIRNFMSVYPNPCLVCEVKGVDDVKNILITDLLGRQINTTFTKTGAGYQITLNTYQSGLFIIKNIQTGEVRKFIKE